MVARARPAPARKEAIGILKDGDPGPFVFILILSLTVAVFHRPLARIMVAISQILPFARYFYTERACRWVLLLVSGVLAVISGVAVLSIVAAK